MKNYLINKLTSVVAFCLAVVGTLFCQQQQRPRIEVDETVQSKRPFTLQIVAGDTPITFCQRLNVSIATPDGLESAPRPVEVEKRDEAKGKWFRYTANLPDIGVAFEPVSLTARKSRSFRLQVESPGDYRLIFRFRRQDERAVCPAVGKRWRTVVSRELHVRQ